MRKHSKLDAFSWCLLETYGVHVDESNVKTPKRQRHFRLYPKAFKNQNLLIQQVFIENETIINLQPAKIIQCLDKASLLYSSLSAYFFTKLFFRFLHSLWRRCGTSLIGSIAIVL